MAWNLPTNYANSTQGLLTGIATWAYDVTNGWYWTALLIGFAFVMFVTSAGRFGTTRAFAFGAWVGMVGAIFFAILKLMPWGTASIFIIAGAIGIAISVAGKSRV